MDLDLAPSWPPPGRWYLGLAVGGALAALIPIGPLFLSGISLEASLLVAGMVAAVLCLAHLVGRWMSSRRPRLLRLPDSELTAVIKLIDQAAQQENRALLKQAIEYLVLHRRITKRDASTAVGKLLRRDYPLLANRFGYLD